MNDADPCPAPRIAQHWRDKPLNDAIARLPSDASKAIAMAFDANLDGLAAWTASHPQGLACVPPALAPEIFRLYMRHWHPRLLAIDNGFWTASKAAIKAAKAADSISKASCWRMLAEAGMPVVHFQAPLDWSMPAGDRKVQAGEDSAGALAIEAARGGALDGEALLMWGSMAMFLPLDLQMKAFGGLSALAFAFSRGMRVSDWTHQILEDLILHLAGGCPDQLMADLRAAGARIGPRSRPIAFGCNNDRKTIIERLLSIGLTRQGVMDAARIGIDLFELDPFGEPVLMALHMIKQPRGSAHAKLAEALLDAAESLEAGGRERLLAMRAKDGSGPMHWAARALCPESVDLFASLGCKASSADNKGRTPGHWAAAKYGAKNASKVGPALAALARAGADWAALDKSGQSAMAALSARGQLEPIASLISMAPDAAEAKSQNAKSALETLRDRPEPQALAVAEQAIMTSLAGGAGSNADGKSKKRL